MSLEIVKTETIKRFWDQYENEKWVKLSDYENMVNKTYGEVLNGLRGIKQLQKESDEMRKLFTDWQKNGMRRES